ncbi:MAG: uroporphyrinogen-III C-methyltransferase, partial [Pseudomonadota bacterium]|nr:uroporphyrinogen-III C-methyltransferase [Pseudomonadota bacterium]
IQPLRTAEDEFLIKQHFALTVAQAKLALMQKQPAIFASSVAESAAVLEQNFSADNPTVQSVVESLQGLQSQELWPKKVDLSEIVASISALSAE